MDEVRLGEIERYSAQWPEHWAAEICAALRAAWAERDDILRERNDLATRGNVAVQERNALGLRAERAEAERDRLRDALEAYCAGCPNCRGKGRRAGQDPYGRLADYLCGTCGWARAALGKA